MDTPDAAEFDRWYAVVAGSARWQELVAVQLGLPDGFVATGFLSGNGLEEIGERLDLVEDDTLVDLGCGRAGYGLALVHHTGARLIGVDFSAVALAGAAEDAAARGLSDRTHFHVADLTATGLPAGTASAVVCVDALQFARSAPEALTECRRILQPGGRIAITTWAADADQVAVPERIRRLDLARDLVAAGFADVDVQSRPEWSATEVGLWSAAVAVLDADPALAELGDEARGLLPLAGSLRRVLAVARRPA